MSYYNYSSLKEIAKGNRTSVENLIALSPSNDPFYVGKPSDIANGEWFSELWEQFGYSRGVHLRRVHYQIVSQSPTIKMPNGEPYENTERCWDFLGQASKMARYLELVDPAAFVDRRNHDPIINAANYEYEPYIEVTGSATGELELPDFPELPSYYPYSFDANQPFLLEIWCEKTTMDDVLQPLCTQYGVNLVRGVGEMSITATLDLTNRITADGRPTRVFYISDFDPAGKSMPVAVSRKAEYFVRKVGDEVDIRLFPIVLTEDQVRSYRLPRTPIKETESRRGKFEERFGTGATELDALEALRPGELARVVRKHLDHYFDHSLNRRVYRAEQKLRNDLSAIVLQGREEHADEIEEIKSEYEEIKAEFLTRLAAHNERRAELFETLNAELTERMPDIEDYPIPEAEVSDEVGEGLYNSERDYLDQIDAYKEFQGK